MKIAAYIRVSTEDQKEKSSHIGQRERIAQWADSNGYDSTGWGGFHETNEDGEIEDWESIDGETTGDVHWFEDIAISGQSDKRDAYNRLVESFDDFDYLVVRELSRFGRDPLTVLQDIEKITDSDTEFVSITVSFDTSSAMGKAFVRLVAVINGMYADLRREQAIAAAERRKEQGLPVGRPRKLQDELINEVVDLRQKGVSYSAIARVIEAKPNGPESISRETIRRYCVDSGLS